VFAFIVHALVIPQIGGARRALDVVGSVSPWLLGTAVVLYSLALLAYAELTRRLASPQHEFGLGIAFTAVLSSNAVNRVVPGGAATTAAVNYRVLGRAGVSGTDLGFVLGVQAIGSAVVLNLLLWVALLVSIPSTGSDPVYITAAAVGATLITLLAVAVAGLLRGRDRFARTMSNLLGRLPRVDGDRIEANIELVADRLGALAADRRRLAIATLLAAANWLFDAAALWVSIAAFGHRPDPVGVLVAYSLANVIAAVPVSPGGLGVIEAILIPTLVGFGTPPSEAAIGVVAYRFVTFWLPIPIGAIAYGLSEHVAGWDRRRRFRDEIRDQVEARSGRPTTSSGTTTTGR
jgi:putative heme transporter